MFFFGKFYPSSGGGVRGDSCTKIPPEGDTTGSPLYNVTKMTVSAPIVPKMAKKGGGGGK